MKPKAVFDAREWNRVYDGAPAEGQFAVFRRSAEMAKAACASLMQTGEHWLDLGSGTGQLAHSLRETGATITSVDHSLVMLQMAGSGMVARAEQLPVLTGELRGVVSVSLVGCLPDIRAFYAEVHRVLQPGGYAVITYTNRKSWLLWLNYLFTKPSGDRFERFQRAEVCQSLERAGFEVASLRFYNCVLHAGAHVFPSHRVAQQLERLQVERLARNFIVVARKRERGL